MSRALPNVPLKGPLKQDFPDFSFSDFFTSEEFYTAPGMLVYTQIKWSLIKTVKKLNLKQFFHIQIILPLIKYESKPTYCMSYFTVAVIKRRDQGSL